MVHNEGENLRFHGIWRQAAKLAWTSTWTARRKWWILQCLPYIDRNGNVSKTERAQAFPCFQLLVISKPLFALLDMVKKKMVWKGPEMHFSGNCTCNGIFNGNWPGINDQIKISSTTCLLPIPFTFMSGLLRCILSFPLSQTHTEQGKGKATFSPFFPYCRSSRFSPT